MGPLRAEYLQLDFLYPIQDIYRNIIISYYYMILYSKVDN